jgi:fermentation-respiration switch protein FrsA (DUF1100 family)
MRKRATLDWAVIMPKPVTSDEDAHRRKWKKLLVGDLTLRRVIISAVEIYVCVLAWAWFFSDRIAFQPPPPTYSEGTGITYATASSGEKIAMLSLTNAGATHVVLFAHGNAEDIGCVRDLLEEYRNSGFEVCTFDYRGYGLSQGRPSTSKSYEDIEAVYAELVGRRGVDPRGIIVHGRSLGAAVVLRLAARRPVGGVIVESAFVTAFRVKTRIPLFPIDKMRNNREIRKLRCPVLVIHGEADEAIGAWHGKLLFGLAREPKSAYWVPNAGHDDVCAVGGGEYWKQIRAFAESVKK